MSANISTLDVCGKRTIDYVCHCLAKFNRDVEAVTIRAIGRSVSKAVEIAQILQKELQIDTDDIKTGVLRDTVLELPFLEFTFNNKPIFPTTTNSQCSLLSAEFVEYPIYHLLLDWYLHKNGKLMLATYENVPLITIIEENGGVKCQKSMQSEKLLNDINSALYRCGFFLPANWKSIAARFTEFDDIILGLDTNILYDCMITECLLPAISLTKPKQYIYTPNWLLFVIPCAVMHELEKAANIRNRGFLKLQGRMGFRALQEIIELSQGIDIVGISVVIAGEANPMLDIRMELQGLREDLFEIKRQIVDKRGEVASTYRLFKSASGDAVIRDQFKKFLRQIDFYKGAYFLTADKSNAALARTEGLCAIQFLTPHEFADETIQELTFKFGNQEIRLSVPIGKIIYELAVQFGTIRINWGFANRQIEIQCDEKGENLDNWVHKRLRLEPRHLDMLLQDYQGKLNLNQVLMSWNRLCRVFEQEE